MKWIATEYEWLIAFLEKPVVSRVNRRMDIRIVRFWRSTIAGPHTIVPGSTGGMPAGECPVQDLEPTRPSPMASAQSGGNRKLGGRDPGDSRASIAAMLDWGRDQAAGSTLNRSWAEDNACAPAQHGSADRAVRNASTYLEEPSARDSRSDLPQHTFDVWQDEAHYDIRTSGVHV